MISIFDLQELYKIYFHSTPYHVPKNEHPKEKVDYSKMFEIPANDKPLGTIFRNSKGIPINKKGNYGKEIWFPVEFKKSDTLVLTIDACTVSVNLSKTVVKSAVSERKGTVKESFNVDDYKFSIKGFLIGKNRIFPEDQINALKDLFETTEPVSLHGGYPEVFLDASCRVVIHSLEFPEVQGRSQWIRPFSLTCESDFIQDLLIK